MVAWVATQVPSAVDDLATTVALARRAADSAPDNWSYAETLGAAHYRAGEWDQAVLALDRAVKLQKEGGTVWMKCFLAMAHHRLGHYDEAQAWLDKAYEHINREAAPDFPNPPDWQERVRRRLLYREAAELLAQRPRGPGNPLQAAGSGKL